MSNSKLASIQLIYGGNILGYVKSKSYTEYPLYYTERNWDYGENEGFDFMEFRLIYEGELRASGNNKTRPPKEKHVIRKQIHKQLAELWDIHPSLKEFKIENNGTSASISTLEYDLAPLGKSYVDTLANNNTKSGFRFVPLVHKKLDLICSLDILFLRREDPGELLKQGGDVDNRVKTLLDALQIPQHLHDLTDQSPEVDENPFYCLLENDSLVTELNITTDRLLTPIRSGGNKNDVVLVIRVKIKAVRVLFENLELISS